MKSRFALLVALALGAMFAMTGTISSTIAQENSCEKLGWFPEEFGLKDHSVFWYNGYYYLVSIKVPPGDPNPLAQDEFAYARTEDFCVWEDLTPVLPDRIEGSWDEEAIWAPFVFQEDDDYYMYYTGVTRDVTQSILLATTINPSDPTSWQPQEMVFQPNHHDMVWEVGSWADCRDPIVFKSEDIYYLLYTGLDEGGGIIGLATADTPTGPWKDRGGILGPRPEAMLESPTVVQFDGHFYLFYNLASTGEYYQVSDNLDLFGHWSVPRDFLPGWAHEIWMSDDKWGVSYLPGSTSDGIRVSTIVWNLYVDPPRPIIGSKIFGLFFPMVFGNK